MNVLKATEAFFILLARRANQRLIVPAECHTYSLGEMVVDIQHGLTRWVFVGHSQHNHGALHKIEQLDGGRYLWLEVVLEEV